MVSSGSGPFLYEHELSLGYEGLVIGNQGHIALARYHSEHYPPGDHLESDRPLTAIRLLVEDLPHYAAVFHLEDVPPVLGHVLVEGGLEALNVEPGLEVSWFLSGMGVDLIEIMFWDTYCTKHSFSQGKRPRPGGTRP